MKRIQIQSVEQLKDLINVLSTLSEILNDYAD